MRFTAHVADDLAAYRDGQIDEVRARAIDAHLARCAACRAAYEEIGFSAKAMADLALMTPPPSAWAAVEAAALAPPRPARIGSLAAAAAWVVAVAATAAALWWGLGAPAGGAWEVVRFSRDDEVMRLDEGDWVETDGSSRARILVGRIGAVEVAPSTRVRLGEEGPAGYRLALERGRLSARISAPPRLFIVETPASAIVDLGCAYSIEVARDGTGILRVTEGWAALEWHGRESLVPAGARSRILAGIGPGTPYFEDASTRLVDALASLDAGDGATGALQTVLAEARVRDTLTLWHLLSRVDARERSTVYDRMVVLAPRLAPVSRDAVLALDPATLRQVREELAWTW